MRYFFAIFFPPLAVLAVGRPFSAVLNVFLTIFGWFPGVLHAIMLVRSAEEGGHHKDQMKALRDQRDLMMLQIEMAQLQHMHQMAASGGAVTVPRHLQKRKRR